ncbi:MAG TPA: protein translocase subunit SecF [Vicinamibacterales bacterium]|jgi:preprotein translocase subunit SecF
MRIFTHVNIDWLRWRWHALAMSWLIILSGVFVIATRGIPLGIDFSGGTLVMVQFEKTVGEDVVRSAIEGVPGDKSVQRYGEPDRNQILIRLPLVASSGAGQAAADVVKRLQAANVGNFKVLSSENVGPVIGEDLRRKGLYATVLSMFGIMSYIAIRFRWSFGVGAFVATLHDLLITMSIFTFAGYELSLNIIASLLTLIGYGVNDQIVIFDRVRENLRTSRSESMNSVINKSVNQTLRRTVVTAGVTALAVLGLYLFGGEVLRPFAFVMLVGVITSTYSTVFIASAVAELLSRHRRRTVSRAAASAVETPSQPPRRSKQKKQRAS